MPTWIDIDDVKDWRRGYLFISKMGGDWYYVNGSTGAFRNSSDVSILAQEGKVWGPVDEIEGPPKPPPEIYKFTTNYKGKPASGVYVPENPYCWQVFANIDDTNIRFSYQSLDELNCYIDEIHWDCEQPWQID